MPCTPSPFPARCEQITLDGPAASGKSTLAAGLAEELDGYYINTGEMYRAVAWMCARQRLHPDRNAESIPTILKVMDLRHRFCDGRVTLVLNDEPVPIPELRTPEVTQLSSRVASIPIVRAWLLDRQRDAARLGLIVMEGRDIGTVVFPHARHKFFITATPEERARRRLAQKGEVPAGATVEAVAREIAERDERDSTRVLSPLRPAPDAVMIDTTGRIAAELVAELAAIIRARWTLEPAPTPARG